MSIVAARQRIRSYIAGWRSPGGWSLSPAAALGLLLAGGLLLRLLIAFVLFPQAGLYNDLRFFTDWSVVLAEHGPGGFYANVAWSDYPPGYLWVLWLFGSLGRGVALLTGGSVAGTIEYWIKLPAILADLAVAVIFYGAIRRWQGHRPALLVAGGWLFTPVSWYDSALWGQVDVFGVLLMGLAVIWLIDRRPELASAAAVAAFLVKPQFAIVVGVVGIVLLRRHLLARRGAAGDSVIERRWPERLYAHRFEEGPLRLVLAAVAGLAVLLAGTLPFDLERFADPALAGVPVVGDLAGLAGLIGSAAGFYNVLTANAFNPWALVGPTPLVTSLTGDYVWTFDSLPILGVPASAWGAGLFLAVTAGVTLLLLRRDDRLAILVGITVLAVAFFVLPTRVHERYLFGAVGLGALLLATSIGWRIWFIAISAVGLVNMHAILTLPFRGYGTFEMRALPFAQLAREPIVVALTAVVSVALLAWPIYQDFRLWRSGRTPSGPPPPPEDAHPPETPEPPLPPPAGDKPKRKCRPKAKPSEMAWPMRRIEWLLAGLRRRPVPPRRVARVAPAAPPVVAAPRQRRLDGLDWLAIGGLVLVASLMRLPGLDRPLGMYFDETLHVRTATEFLQPIRYGIPPREILEWTHPPLAKYAIAASVGLLGGHPLTGLIDAQVDTRDAAVEPARPASGPLAAQPSRLYLLAPEGVRIIDVDSGQSLGALPVEGGTALAVDGVNQRLLVGTVAGEVRAWSTVALALGGQVQSRVVAQAEAPVERVWSVGGTVATWAGDLLQLWTGDSPLAMPITDVVDLVALPGEPRRLAVLHAGGLRVLDATTFAELQTVPLPFGVTGMALVEGDDFENRNRGVMPYNLIYVAAAGSLERIEGIDDGGELRVGGRITVPGTAVDVDWNPATNIVHVLGTHAGAPAVFLMDPHGEAIFAETRLPYSPIAWSMDVRRDTPATDRQRLVVVAGDGRAATLAIGGTLAAARLPGALLGVAMIGLLYALARLLFRRRGLALLAGGLALLDGLLFAQSRIATPDVYTAFFVIAAYAALAAVVGPGERAPLPSTRRILAGLAAVGLLIGLAAATKWTGVYALGGAMFFCLLVAPGRLRWLAVGALAAGGGVLALRALAGSPPNVAFAGLVVGLVVLTALLVRRWEREPSALSWPVTGRQLAAGLGLMVGAALVTYFVLFLPYLGLDPARGDFIAAQLEMFRFHEGSVQAHGAGSPWWSWPLMLKPLWAYMESFAGTQAGIVMAANPVVVWLTSAAVAWGAARLVRRVDPALVLILVAFAFQWLIWARIDRVAFMYHYYTALPFAIVALAALLWRLWHAGTGRAWLYARVAVIVAAAIPAVLWVFADPLCGSLNVNAGAHVCAPDWSLSVPAPAAVLTLTVVVGGALASWWAWRALAVRGIEWARGVRGRTELVIVAGVIVGTLLAAHLVAGVPGFRFGLLLIPSRMVMAGLAVAVALIAGALVVRARSPRALVWGIVSAAAVLFMLTHPMIQAGLTWPGTVIAFQALLPTAEVSFTFARGTGPVLPVVLYIVLPLGAVALLGWLGLRSLDRRRARHLQGRLAGSDVSAEAAAGGEA